MDCSDIQELLSSYHDGEIADTMRSRVARHLDQCADCAKQLDGFERLSMLTRTLSDPAPPAQMWKDLEEQLDQQPMLRGAAPDRQSALFAPGRLALAATVLIVACAGWLSYRHWFAEGQHDSFTSEFGQYLETFPRDPDAAQKILLARYEGQAVDVDNAIRQVGYRPAVADGLPEGYSTEATYVMKMPCCTCVQTICKRKDGTTLAIFEHDDQEVLQWFGDRARTTCRSHGKTCCLVEWDSQLAASWQRGTRHITLIGARDVAEVDQMVAWMDEKERLLPN